MFVYVCLGACLYMSVPLFCSMMPIIEALNLPLEVFHFNHGGCYCAGCRGIPVFSCDLDQGNC